MTLCDDAEMEALVTAVQVDDGEEIAKVDRLLERRPTDPRLHFLRGSLLAGIGRPIEALASLRRAVEIAPDFAIARFQLGFFQLTSGEPGDALSSWGPLAMLPEDHYLRYFVGGLTHLIRDEFGDCVARLQQGMAANDENHVLNRDMGMIVEKVRALDDGAPAQADLDGTASATSFLLDQFAGRRPS